MWYIIQTAAGRNKRVAKIELLLYGQNRHTELGLEIVRKS